MAKCSGMGDIRKIRPAFAALLAAAVGLATVGTAFAVSSGGYDPAQQDCSPSADSTATSNQAEPGCRSFMLHLSDDSGNRYAQYGIRQVPNNQSPDPTNPDTSVATPSAAWAALLTGAHVYLGADDNLDNGEHDGVSGANGTAGSVNGPSDGGAVLLNWHPGDGSTWLASVVADPNVLFVNPVGIADFGIGACADGVCFSLQTRRRLVYQGGSAGSRDVYDYRGKTWDPYNCSSGSPQEEASCAEPGGPQTMDGYRSAEKQSVYAEPGFQFYEDPDPQSSPIDPLSNGNQHPLYPLPAAYVGTCGVVVGGGATVIVPSSPVTNSAGQLAVQNPGC
ncbi:MAG: hypothetical protein JWO37_3650 [Acidimicrobiales bacterium]|nr:hypothetical protein [Acidimicrobiales bacterium]